jgi:CubicO group peptidase (beta-lactamase class C family)
MSVRMGAVVAALACLPAVAALAAASPESVGLSRERLARIDAMLEQRIAAGDLPGAVVVVARRGQVAHVAVLGTMDLKTKQPMRNDTLFRIASMTKPIVGVGVMLMVEENKLRLSDPVSRYIPEFRNLKVAVARMWASTSLPRSARSRSRTCSRTSPASAADR